MSIDQIITRIETKYPRESKRWKVARIKQRAFPWEFRVYFAGRQPAEETMWSHFENAGLVLSGYGVDMNTPDLWFVHVSDPAWKQIVIQDNNHKR